MKINLKQILLPHVSIVIITKNRPNVLSHCLESLGKQTDKRDEIIIIDGSDNINSYTLVKQFANTVKSNVVHIFEKKSGFSLARNRGIDASKNNLIAFTDDDCIVHNNWVKQIKESIPKNPNIAAVIGKSLTCFPDNIYCLAARYHELCWKLPAINGNTVTDLEILDTKNIVFNKLFIRKNSLRFDESKPFGKNWTNDDIDFGMQIWKQGGKAIYNKRMIVYHKDARTLKGFIKKIVEDSLSYSIYRKKWELDRLAIEKYKIQITSSKIFSYICKQYNLTYVQMICLGTLLFLATQIIRSASIYARIKYP